MFSAMTAFSQKSEAEREKDESDVIAEKITRSA
jgi:hypothetical protein